MAGCCPVQGQPSGPEATTHGAAGLGQEGASAFSDLVRGCRVRVLPIPLQPEGGPGAQ